MVSLFYNRPIVIVKIAKSGGRPSRSKQYFATMRPDKASAFGHVIFLEAAGFQMRTKLSADIVNPPK